MIFKYIFGKICKRACVNFICKQLNGFKYCYVIRILRGSLNKFPDFFRMYTFIDTTHMKLYSPLK